MIGREVKLKSEYSTRISSQPLGTGVIGWSPLARPANNPRPQWLAGAQLREARMLISSKGRYALRLMIYIAAFGDAEGKIALREVAAREDISLKYLEQLVRPLMQAGLLRSVRGKGGGYALSRPADEIRAGDILRAAEGTTAPVACEGLEGACERAGLCSTVKFWTGLDAVIEEYVDGVTLAELARVPEIQLDVDIKPIS